MDEYLRTRQATIGATSASWTYDGNNMLSQVAATGVQQYDYSFDVNTGNLTSRTNYLKSKTESFGYDADNLDRLSSVTGPVNLSVGYTTNKNGNILTKGDAGTYAYDDTPYAVSSIANGQNMSTTQQDVTYFSFEKVKTITEGTKSADFVYNADQQRIRMVLKTNQTVTKTRWYFGTSCERELAGGVTTQYIWIGGDAYTAVAVAKKVGTGAWTVYNIFRDHLGTITHLKNGSNPADEYSFDAWGRRRDKDDWTMTLTGEPALFADRGFTGHEYLEDFKLYNMNGRLYDPVVGRFLNADPFVQDAGNTQSYNRYSYCLNNPLKYTDPSGMIHSHYWLKNQEDGIGGGPGNGGGGDYRGPGWDENGDGANGHYYDYFSGTYRSSASGNPEVSWNNVYYNLIATGNTYSTLDMGRHDRVYENAYRPNPDGKIRLFVTYTDCVIVSGSYFDNNPASGRVDDISQAGLNFIAGYEGFSATTYNDVAELPTIGYGHLIKPGESFGTLSRNAALQLLRKDASFAVNAVNKYVTVSLSQNQFDALTSLTFNIGAGAFSKSTVLSDVNSGNTLSIDKSFMMWNKARIDGVLTPMQGLTNRRQAESNLFLNGNY